MESATEPACDVRPGRHDNDMKSALSRPAWKLMALLHPRIQALVLSMRNPGRARRGRGTYIHRSVQILGKRYVSVGANSVLSEECWLNVNHRNGGEAAIEIGSQCFIGRRNFFSSGKKIVLGDYVLTANDCHFLGSSHVVQNPMLPYLSTGTTDSDVITVGHNTFIGAGASILGNVNVGHGSIIGARALVTRDIPPFSQAIGAPARVVRRYSMRQEAWIACNELTDEDEEQLPTAELYLSILQKCPPIRMPFIAAGSDMGQC